MNAHRIAHYTQERNAYYFQFAAMVVNAYDIVITADDEVNFIWNRPWKPATLLYLVNRYFVLIESVLNIVSWIDPWLSPQLCINLNLLTSVWTAPVATTLMEAILVIRVCTLFCNQRTVVIGLWALLFSSTVVAIVFSAMLTPAFGYYPSPLPPLYGCEYTNAINYEMLQTWIFIPSIVVELVLVILTVVKTCEHLRSSTGLRSALTIILRDGCLYFIVVLVLMVVNAVTLGLDNIGAYNGAILQPELSLASVLCSRMFLNLRKSIYRLKDAQARAWEGVGQSEETSERADIHMATTPGPQRPTPSTTWGTESAMESREEC